MQLKTVIRHRTLGISVCMNCVVIIHYSEIITCNIIKSQNKEIFYWIIMCDDVAMLLFVIAVFVRVLFSLAYICTHV